jgi:hypothetical protein
MKQQKFRQDNGQAGLTVFLSLIVMLFIIGLIVMIFSLMGGELESATYDELTAGTVVNESVTVNSGAGATLAKSSLRDGACGTITKVFNATNHYVISAGNYTQVGCNLKNTTSDGTLSYTGWKVSYPYTYTADNTATNVMNDTVNGISGATDWFDIFIVIGAMVVLILLTVIIVTAIKGSGITGGQTSDAGKIGTA